jgi:dihydroneopterin aldolase / 2-amino-4-hydroxy-6-hydroxymethyldihydropteridine diphosphokinase / dihydropteroate synthase
MQKITITIEKSRGLLHAQSVGIEVSRSLDDLSAMQAGTFVSVNDMLFIKDLTVSCIIGIYPWERVERQRVVLDLNMFQNCISVAEGTTIPAENYRTITRKVIAFVEQSSYKTVEALVQGVCNLLVSTMGISKVTVKLLKPSAITFAEGAGVEVTRTAVPQSLQPTSEVVDVYLGIGSNIEYRQSNFNNALSMLLADGTVNLVTTSFLYETAPMYVVDQPKFLNAVIKVFLTK